MLKKKLNVLIIIFLLLIKKINAREYSQFKLINNIKEMVYKNGIKNDNKFNITAFKLTQKLNLIYQKKAISYMINILKNVKKMKLRHMKILLTI